MCSVIRVENLGKRYLLSHQSERQPYLALRDVITEGVKDLGRRLTGHQRRSPLHEEFWALRDVSFEVNQGDRVGIIGRNGAGKSTLLKILSRITEPTTGRVTIKGRVASLLEVGTGFHPELTGRENIFLNGAILGMSRAEIKQKFDEIVDFAEIEKFLDTPVKRYSSGMYVRLAFAVAAHLEPEILVVDEVLAVGDAQFQKKCLGKMEDVSIRGGRTVLFVSHNMPSIRALCEKVILIENGRLNQEGEASDVIGSYLISAPRKVEATVNLIDASRSAGRVRCIHKAWLEDEKGEMVTSVPMGMPVTICFSYLLDKHYASPDFGFGIDSLDGFRVFSVNNTVTSDKPLTPTLHGIARCEIPSLPLLPGVYLISLSVVDSQVEWVDYVERAMSFEVVPHDIYGTGKIFERSQGIIFTSAKVTVHDSTEY